MTNKELQNKLDQQTRELDEVKNKLSKFERIATRFLDNNDKTDLCSDGQELYDDVSELLGRPVTVDGYMTFRYNGYCNFELPTGSDPTDCNHYTLVLKRSDTDEVLDEFEPDEVDYDG